MKYKTWIKKHSRNFWIILEFEIRAFFADKSNIFKQLFLDPVASLIFLGAGFSGLIGNQIIFNDTVVSYISYIFPGILTIQMLGSFSQSVYRITLDRHWGLQAVKMISGTGRIGYILAIICIPSMIFVIQLIISLPIAAALGATVSAKGVFMIIVIGILITAFWTCFAILVTMLLKTNYSQSFFLNFATLFLTLSAPIFYSLDKAPQYLKILSSLNPVTYQVNAMRQAFLSETLFNGGFYNLVLASALFVGAFLLLNNAEYIDQKK